MLDRKAVEDLLDRARTLRIAGDVDGLMELFHDDATFEMVGFGPRARGKEAISKALRGLVDAFEFLEFRPEKTLVDGNDVAVRYGLKLRHRPSGKAAETEVFDYISMRDGQFVRYVQHADTALAKDLVAS